MPEPRAATHAVKRFKRILLMHVSMTGRGHYRASVAVEQALQRLEPSTHVLNVDAFTYTNPILKRLLTRTYGNLITVRPDVWEYLYDNPRVLRQVRVLRELLHRYNARKLGRLIQHFAPDVIACTQAFPCGMAADYRQMRLLQTPVVGILTDHAPHAYWFYDSVSAYVVPSEAEAQVFRSHGIGLERVRPFGIPIDPQFGQPPRPLEEIRHRWGLTGRLPVVVVMGGGQGLGPMRQMVRALQESSSDLQLVVLAGSNRWLRRWLKRKGRRQIFTKPMRVEGYVNDVRDLMDVASVLVTKPGGLTTAEALSRGLPMVFIQPLPGQEMYNARFLTEHGCAVWAASVEDGAHVVGGLLQHPARLSLMRQAARDAGRPEAALRTARLLLKLCDR